MKTLSKKLSKSVHFLLTIYSILADEFYEKNATDLDHLKNGEYWLMSSEQDSNDDCEESSELKPDLSDDKIEDLPF